MTLSPMQHDYVTYKEFNGLKSYIDDGFDKTNEHIDHVETKLDNLETKVDNLETKVDKLNTKVDKIEAKVDKLETKVDKLTTKMEVGLKDLKGFTLEGFEKMEEYIDKSNKETAQKVTTQIISHFDRRFDQVKTEIIGQINR